MNMDIDFDETICRFARLHPRRMELANIVCLTQKARKGHFRQLKLKKFPGSTPRSLLRSLRLRRSFCSKSVNIFPRSAPVSPTLFQTDLRITDHRGHKFSPSVNWLHSVQNSNSMATKFSTIASFSSVFLQLVQCSRQHPSFSAHWAPLMTKTDLNYPAFSLRFVDFAAQFWFHCKFSFHEKRRSR